MHETAEEEIVHPLARRAIGGGEILVRALVGEEGRIEVALSELEMLDVDSDEFRTKLVVLRAMLLAHARAEERSEFHWLTTRLDRECLERMRRVAALAAAVAPSRPHGGIRAAIANLLVGPFASMLALSRDALSGR